MSHFENGDLVKVVGWDSPAWENHTYMVDRPLRMHSRDYYLILLIDEDEEQSKIYPAGTEGAFTPEHLKYVGPRGQEINLFVLSVPELVSLIAKATARLIELTKNS